MSGLDDKQWTAVERRLSIIDNMATEINNIKSETKDINLSVNQLQVEFTSIHTSLFGVTKSNGLNSQIKKNTVSIEELKKIMPQKPDEATSKKIRGWMPVIICVLLFLFSLYDRIENAITNNIQQMSIQASPTP